MIVIFAAICICLISIYVTVIQWRDNKQTLTTPVAAVRLSQPQPLRLSATPLSDKAAPPRQVKAQARNALDGITLSGIIVSSDPAASRAILNEGGEQNIYALHQPLKTAADTQITAISRNQIVLSQRGDELSLTLLAELDAAAVSAGTETHSQLALADYIEASLIRDSEAVRGLRLLPRNQTLAFGETGLLPGDLAVRLDNLSLTQPDSVSQAMEMLNTRKRAQFTIIRNSQPRLINVSVSQFDEVKDN
ncbi:type II secretion system protein GspC [Citrobacter rodentium]|uniref:Type II secretion system protein GspC n=1 Tax=Citrobacter rodentium TaxID=67825 RepID=A0A482PS01_CITRO|nr:type II secretion system protein GspC [Citrobacter rodentium]